MWIIFFKFPISLMPRTLPIKFMQANLNNSWVWFLWNSTHDLHLQTALDIGLANLYFKSIILGSEILNLEEKFFHQMLWRSSIHPQMKTVPYSHIFQFSCSKIVVRREAISPFRRINPDHWNEVHFLCSNGLSGIRIYKRSLSGL